MLRGRVRQISVTQDRAGDCLVQGRSEDVAAVGRVVQQRRQIGFVERRVQPRESRHRIELPWLRADFLQPPKCTQENAFLGDYGVLLRGVPRQREAVVGEPLLPGVEAIAARIDVFGKEPLEARGGQILEYVE